MAPEMRAKRAVVAQALLLPLCGKMASAVTQCEHINTCSECSGHTFGCENPGLLGESWPWGTSMADSSVRMHAACKEPELVRMHPLVVRQVSAKFGALGLTPLFARLLFANPQIGKMSNATECYFRWALPVLIAIAMRYAAEALGDGVRLQLRLVPEYAQPDHGRAGHVRPPAGLPCSAPSAPSHASFLRIGCAFQALAAAHWPQIQACGDAPQARAGGKARG